MLSSICRGKAAAGIFLLKPRSKTSGNGGYITEIFLGGCISAYNAYIFLRFMMHGELLHIIVAYGVSISAVADNLISNVKYKVEEFTNMDVNKINVIVEGVRITE